MFSINSDESVTALRSESTPKTSYLDQNLWHQFSSAETIEEFAQQWLTLQCGMLLGVKAGVVVYDLSHFNRSSGTPNEEKPEEGKNFAQVAHWPKLIHHLDKLYQSAEVALSKKQAVVKKLVENKDNDSVTFFHLAFPFIIQQQCVGSVVLEVSDVQEGQIAALMRQIQWGCAWFEIFEQKRTHLNTLRINQKLEALSRLVASYVDYQQYSLAAAAVLNELAIELQCERVSLGFVKGYRIEVDAISNSAKFDKKTNLLRAIQEAMQEAVDQQHSIHYPQQDGFELRKKHQVLSEIGHSGSLLSVPILELDKKDLDKVTKVRGVLLFEHQDPKYFNRDNQEYCEQIGYLIGPLLNLKKRQSRNVFQICFDTLRDLLGAIFGPRYLLSKLISLSVVVVICALAFYKTTYRVNADAVLEGWLQRTIAAPQDGFIRAVQHRPGDVVNQGDVLFQLDDKELQLEQLRWQSEKLKINQEYLDAFSSHDKTQVGILKARLAQVDANLSLVQSQIEKTQAMAPFEGVIVSGDLSQSLGSPVQKGEVLMQVAPLDKYRVILNVDEKEIRQLSLGQQGQLVLSSMPDERLDFTINRLTPMAEVTDGANIFKVEAQLDQHYEWLRPGMQGTGKIEIGEKSYLWIMSRNFMTWLKVWLWSSRI